MNSTSITRDNLVVRKEHVYFALSLAFSIAVWLVLLLLVLTSATTAGSILFYALLFGLMAFLVHGMFIGRLRANAVKLSAQQLPGVYRIAEAHCAKLGLDMPDVYVLHGGGILNAFATKLLGRRFVVLYADVLGKAKVRGDAAVGFVVAHELGHLHRNHLRWRLLLAPSRFLPYLGSAYSRACEYTCDRYGAYLQPDGALDGLLLLTTGRDLYDGIDVSEYARQAETETGFFVKRSEIMSSHPHMTKRVSALLAAGLSRPATSPDVVPLGNISHLHPAGAAPTA